MSSADLTRYALSLGARDATTGWCAKSFASSTIQGSIQPRGAVISKLPCGNYAAYPQTLFTPNYIHIGDQVKDAGAVTYEVKAVDQWWRLDQFSHYTCSLEKISPFASTRPDTSATWHTDSDSIKTDPRERTKTWLDAYDTPAHIGGNYVYMFSGVDYPMQLEFIDNALEGLYVIGDVSSTAEYTYDHNPYKFNESVPIHIYTVDKAAVTGTVLAEQMEQELRYIGQAAENYATASWRLIPNSKNERLDLGGLTVYHTVCNLRYTRENDDYVPTYPTVTWGPSAAATGTFTFPNVVDFRFSDPDTGDVRLFPPGRMGNITQILGLEDWEVTFTCDLDAEHTDLTWMRPQTAVPKTDHNNWQVFQDIKFNGKYSSAQTYQTLNFGHGATATVRLVDYSVDNSTLTVTFRKYSSTAGTAYTSWYGTS